MGDLSIYVITKWSWNCFTFLNKLALLCETIDEEFCFSSCIIFIYYCWTFPLVKTNYTFIKIGSKFIRWLALTHVWKLIQFYEINIYQIMIFRLYSVWTSEHTEKVRVNKANTCILWNRRQSPGLGKIPSRRPSAVPALSP